MYSGLAVIFTVVALVTHAEEKIKSESLDDKDGDGELNLGHHYYEGDIRLTPKQHDVLEGSSDGSFRRALTSEAERLWPKGIIPYVVNPFLREASKRFIASAVNEWNTRTCIKLVPKTAANKNYIEFVYEGGCSSNLGMVGGKQTISVGGRGITCQHGNIVHEIAHTVGFFHEHSRPDRKSFIRVKWTNIKPGYLFNFKAMPKHMIDSKGVGYDYGSITHYGTKFFSKNGSPTITTTQAVPFNVIVGQRVRLSETDVRQANLLYGCSAQRSKIETPKTAKRKEKDDIAKPKKASTLDSQTPSKENKDGIASKTDKGTTVNKAHVTSKVKAAQQLNKAKEDMAKIAKQTSPEDKEENGELNLSHHYFEGDMMLTPQQNEFVDKATKNVHPKTVQKVVKPATKKEKSKIAKQNSSVDKVNQERKVVSAQKAAKTQMQEDKGQIAKQNGKTSTLGHEEINGELNLDHHYFEGDIMLTPQQNDFIKKSRSNHNLFSRGLSSDITKLWPNGVVPYVYGNNLKPQTKALIQSAIKEWNTKTCVNIRPKLASDFHYIEFVYRGGCSSYVGKVGNRQYLSVGGPNIICKHGNIVHELAHALGFYHEHSRPDRDEHISINWSNIIPGFVKNFVKETETTVNSLGVAYDFNSVMHYGDKFFSKKRAYLKTIETKPAGQSIGQRVGLSDLDIKQAKLLYKCQGVRKDTVNVPPNVVIATKKDETKVTKHKTTKKSNHLKNAVKQFTKTMENKPKKTIENTVELKPSKRDNIIDLEQTDDPMQDADDKGGMQLDSEETKPLTLREQEAIAELTHNKAANIEQISGEENIGKHYFEGDMMLSDEQKQWFDSATTDSSPAKKRALIKNPTYLWDDHVMPYKFHKSVDKLGRKYALGAIKHWEEKSCMRFPKRKKEKNYVMFVFEGGCSSRVGRVGGMQKINIGSVKNHCKKGNIIHEMGHALGYFHEQSRTDRNKFVKILKKNVVKWYLNNFHKFDEDFVDERGVPYDYNSIMHYGRNFFSYNHLFFPTIVPLWKTYKDKPIVIGQREGLSDMDILQGNLLYHCDGKRRLTKKESENLIKSTQGTFTFHDDQGPVDTSCKDKYDYASCAKIKSHGYCQTFPNTLRYACGQTCQLCGTTPSNSEYVNTKKNLFTKLNLS